MKVLDKIALVLFSSIILILSALFCFAIFGWISVDVMSYYVKLMVANDAASKVALGVFTVFILLAIKGIFFTNDSQKDKSIENGILIENENGKLLISKDTIQNLVSGVVKGFENTQDVNSKVILTKDNNIMIDVTLFVTQDAIIKDLSNKLQLKIKEVIKQSMDIEIAEVNIKIRNIAPKQENESVGGK